MDAQTKAPETPPVTRKGPEWAHGCPNCKMGITNAMPLTGAINLVMERIIQMDDGLIEFCECRAGKAYHAYLFNKKQELIEEARRNPLMTEQAQRRSHVDLDNARHAIYHMQPAPTIHGETA